MNERTPDNPRDARPLSRPNPDRLVNRILDAESEGQLHEAKRLRHRGRAIDPRFDARLAAARAAAAELTLLPHSPDLSGSILDEVDRCRGFVTRAHRRRVTAWRAAILAGALATFAVAMVLQRFAPRNEPVFASSSPVSHFVDAGSADLSATVRSLGDALGAVRDGLVQPAAVLAAAPAPAGGLALGDASKYEPGLRLEASAGLGGGSGDGFGLLPSMPDGRAPGAPLTPTMRVVSTSEIASVFPAPTRRVPDDLFGVFGARRGERAFLRSSRLDDPRAWLEEPAPRAPDSTGE